MTERIHPVTIEGHDLTALAHQVGRLRYDALMTFMTALTEELRSQADADRDRGRETLAHLLDSASHEIDKGAERIGRAFRVCEKHMQEELTKVPSLID